MAQGGMISFILGLGGNLVVPAAFVIPGFIKHKQPHETVIQYMTCGGMDLQGGGGGKLQLGLWDNLGRAVAYWWGHDDEKLEHDDIAAIYAPHTEIEGKGAADPQYVMVSARDTDAICVVFVSVTNEVLSGTITGDLLSQCGIDFYLNQRPIGAERTIPRGIWLDSDQSNGVRTRSFSWRFPDFGSSSDMAQSMSSDTDLACNSTARLARWTHLGVNDTPPMFWPPLEYNKDSQNNGEGTDKYPERVYDTIVYDIDAWNRSAGHEGLERANELGMRVLPVAANKRRRVKRQLESPELYDGSKASPTSSGNKTTTASGVLRRQGWNPNIEHLVISAIPEHSAEELCSCDGSFGPDMVSVHEGLYCDMVHKTLYPVCKGSNWAASDDGGNYGYGNYGAKQFHDTRGMCFDMNAKNLHGDTGGLPIRPLSYATTAYWKL